MQFIRSFFIATFYDTLMRGCERRCLGRWRRELLAEVSGDVLEIGSGTGINLPYYPATVGKLVLTDPDPHMRRLLRNKQRCGFNFEIAPYSAEKIDLPDASFDFIVSTLVLCSVSSPHDALKEIFRLLRPGGQLLFLEHVVASQNGKLHRWQKRIEPLWLKISGNCHLMRDTARTIRETGFHPVLIENVSMRGAPSFVRPMIKGAAFKPQQSLLVECA